MQEDLENTFDSLLKHIFEADKTFEVIMETVNKSGEDTCFIAGGTVRDYFLKQQQIPKDIDLFLRKSVFENLRALLEKRGKLILNPFGSPRWFPYQSDGLYYDIIIIENFYNGLWKCGTITEVLNQFDITANAVAFDLKTKAFYNPQSGLEHINRKELRAIRFDYPEINVSSDIALPRNSVLWFRYQYYAKKLDFVIEPVTLKWINSNAERKKDKALFIEHFFNPDIL